MNKFQKEVNTGVPKALVMSLCKSPLPQMPRRQADLLSSKEVSNYSKNQHAYDLMVNFFFLDWHFPIPNVRDAFRGLNNRAQDSRKFLTLLSLRHIIANNMKEQE